jgi:hypothetical protein
LWLGAPDPDQVVVRDLAGGNSHQVSPEFDGLPLAEGGAMVTVAIIGSGLAGATWPSRQVGAATRQPIEEHAR